MFKANLVREKNHIYHITYHISHISRTISYSSLMREWWWQWCLFYIRVMVSNATFNNISALSWRSVLLMEETGIPGGFHRPAASHPQTLSNNVVSITPRHERGFELTTLVVIGTICTGSCKSNYHTITTMKYCSKWHAIP